MKNQMTKLIVGIVFFWAIGVTIPIPVQADPLAQALAGGFAASLGNKPPRYLIEMHDRHVYRALRDKDNCKRAFASLADYDRNNKRGEIVLKGEIVTQNMQRIEQTIYLRGLCMERIGKVSYARRVYTFLLRLNPDFEPMIYRIGDKEYFLSEIIDRKDLKDYTYFFYLVKKAVFRRE